MIEFIIEYWYIILVFMAAGFVVGVTVYNFVKMPTGEQLDKVREWLLWAVTAAEKELGAGTGQLKLRQVYDLFVARFPWLAKVISFDLFSSLVDDALVDMRNMLAKNEAVQALVGVSDHEQ